MPSYTRDLSNKLNIVVNGYSFKMIPSYPDFIEIDMAHRPMLHPLFQQLPDGISEFTFANLYLFRKTHHYHISMLKQDQPVISGRDGDSPFFMAPFGWPSRDVLDDLFGRFVTAKHLTSAQSKRLTEWGYPIQKDRDNFDYLYSRQALTELTGRKLHKKKNLVNTFVRNNEWQGKPLLEEYRDEALAVLDQWKDQHDGPNDYEAAREALEQMWDLQLCGGIYYVDHRPVAYSLGEELALGKTFVVHFEKGLAEPQYKGIYQFVNQAFASILPDKYDTVNREQDLGDPGLRQAKESYHPVGFVEKYRATVIPTVK